LGTLVALAHCSAGSTPDTPRCPNVQVDVMTALVSFDRVFEVLDLKPLIGSGGLGGAALDRAWERGPGARSALASVGGGRPRFVPLSERQRGVAGLAGVDRAGLS